MPDPAVTALPSVPAGQVVATGGLVCADDLPDGLVVADHLGRVVVFNHAAARLTGTAPLNALGREVRQVLPLRDAEGRDWWACVDPYGGLSTRTRHPERPLFLPDGTEFLVTVGYVRAPRFPGTGLDWTGPARPGAGSGSRSASAAPSSGSGWNAAAPTWSPPWPTSSAPR